MPIVVPYLAIKISDAADSGPCALCGSATTALVGPDLFLADRWELVCWDCGLTYAPELMRMLGAYWKRRVEMWGRVTKSA